MSVSNRAEADAAIDAHKDRPLGDVENQKKPVLIGGENYAVFGYKDDPARASISLLTLIQKRTT